MRDVFVFFFFFFNDTATTEIYTLSYTTLFRSDGRSTFLSNDSGSTRLSASNATKGTPIQRSSLRIGTRVTACNRRDRARYSATIKPVTLAAPPTPIAIATPRLEYAVAIA